MRDGDGLLHEEDLAGVVAGVLRPDPRDLQVVPRHQLEPGIAILQVYLIIKECQLISREANFIHFKYHIILVTFLTLLPRVWGDHDALGRQGVGGLLPHHDVLAWKSM